MATDIGLKGDMLLKKELAFEQKVRLPRTLFLIVALLSLGGFLFCTTEVLLSTMGRTLCHAQTCKIVESFSIFSRPIMAALASGFFFLQTIGALSLWWSGPYLLRPLVMLSAIGLGAESIFLWRQFVDYHLHCPFCLIVAGFVLSSSSLILLACKRLAVFGVIIGVSLAMLLTPLSVAPLTEIATQRIHRGSPTETYFLIYSDQCPHCHEVLSFCENIKDLDLYLCPKEKALAFLRTLNISGVPVMLVDRNGEKEILIGSGLILAYLKNSHHPKAKSSLEDFLLPSGVCEENKRCEPLEPFQDL